MKVQFMKTASGMAPGDTFRTTDGKVYIICDPDTSAGLAPAPGGYLYVACLNDGRLFWFKSDADVDAAQMKAVPA